MNLSLASDTLISLAGHCPQMQECVSSQQKWKATAVSTGDEQAMRLLEGERRLTLCMALNSGEKRSVS